MLMIVLVILGATRPSEQDHEQDQDQEHESDDFGRRKFPLQR
jgi:hypothetical protein